jgi:hypothetical protein
MSFLLEQSKNPCPEQLLERSCISSEDGFQTALSLQTGFKPVSNRFGPAPNRFQTGLKVANIN